MAETLDPVGGGKRGIMSFLDPGSQLVSQLTGKEAAKEAKAARATQEAQIARQRQTEAARLAEAESGIARRRALARRPGGRSLLVATSPRGVQALGGT